MFGFSVSSVLFRGGIRMAKVRGTRVYWRPSTSSKGDEPQQILKNSGYISVVLQAVQYKAAGGFWQRVFGGSDKVTVSTQITWQSGAEQRIAAAIQDFRKIAVPSVNPLAIGRNVVLKVPAVADGVEMQVAITAIHDDNLGRTLQILNGDDFKQPLQLAPVAVGQILTITNLVKRAFTDVSPEQTLAATYPGIISEGAVADPVTSNRLVQGYIVVIVKQDDEDPLDFDVRQMAITGTGLTVSGKPIENTYVVYNVSFDPWRGRDPSANWSRKFDAASSKADELIFARPAERANAITAAFDLLKEGGALLDVDDTYTRAEKQVLKKAAFVEVNDKVTANAAQPATSAILQSLSMSIGFLEAPARRSRPGSVDADVAAYAHDLMNAGLHFGFNIRPAARAPSPSSASRGRRARSASKLKIRKTGRPAR
jgi:hypothetical protein